MSEELSHQQLLLKNMKRCAVAYAITRIADFTVDGKELTAWEASELRRLVDAAGQR